MPRILVAYTSSHGQTRKIAEVLARELARAGHEIELADALRAAPPPVDDYDAVVLGSRVQFGAHARRLVNYITDYRAELTATPSYLFAVSMSAAGSAAPDPNGYLVKLFDATRWQPRIAIAVAGALPYRRYNPVLRWVMKQLSKRGGHSTDTGRDHEYTDWAQVRRFAADIARDLASRLAHEPAGPQAHACCAGDATQAAASPPSKSASQATAPLAIVPAGVAVTSPAAQATIAVVPVAATAPANSAAPRR